MRKDDYSMKKPAHILFLLACSFRFLYGTEIQLSNGTAYRGTIISENGDFITLKVDTSDIVINKSLIAKKDGDIFRHDPGAERADVREYARQDGAPPPEKVKKKDKSLTDEWVVRIQNGSEFRGRKISGNARILVLDIDGSPVSIFRNVIVSVDSGSTQRAVSPPETVTAPAATADSGSAVAIRTGTTTGTGIPAAVLPRPKSVTFGTASAGTVKGGTAAAVETPVSDTASGVQGKAVPGPVRVSSFRKNEQSRVSAAKVTTAKVPSGTAGLRVSVEKVSFGDTTVSGSAAVKSGSEKVKAGAAVPSVPPRVKAGVDVMKMSGGDRNSVQPPSRRKRPQADGIPAPSPPVAGSIHVVPAPLAVPEGAKKQYGTDGREKVAGMLPAPLAAGAKKRKTDGKMNVAPPSPSLDTAGKTLHTENTAVQSPDSEEPEQGGASDGKAQDIAEVKSIPPLASGSPLMAPGGVHGAKSGLPKTPHSAMPAKSSPVSREPRVQSTPPAEVKKVISPKRRRRTDGKKELVLKNGTVFIGTVVSQDERTMVFSSDGARITILKRLIKEIDGEAYAHEKESTGSRPSKRRRVVPSREPEENSEVRYSRFRSLPGETLPGELSAAEVSDSMRTAADWKGRSRAARCLGMMGGWGVSEAPAAVELLKDTAQSGTPIPLWIDSVTSGLLLAPGLEAARALAQLGPPGEEQLLRAAVLEDPLIRRHAVFGLGYCTGDAAEKQVAAALKDEDPLVRRTALGSLQPSSAVHPLLTALKDKDPSVRSAAVFMLGKLRQKRTIDALVAMTKDSNRQVRRTVAEILTGTRSEKVAHALVTLCDDRDNFVRAAAVRSLGKTKDSIARVPLLAALKDNSPEVRANAVEGLGLLRDSRSIPSLYSAIKDKDPSVRQKAGIALKQHTELELLIEALDDSSPTVRANVAYVLWLMTGQDNGEDKKKWETWAAGKIEKKKNVR